MIWKKYTKKEWKDFLSRTLLVILGNLFLAFGTVNFLLQCDIVSGGMAGLAIIIQNFLPASITITILQWVFFFLGWIFLGKRFAFQTLVSTIFYPAFVILFENFFSYHNIPILRLGTEAGFSETTILVAGIVGGLFVGLGIGLSLLGGGSTGGFDIISILIAKWTNTKNSLWIFLVDAIIIILGLAFVERSDNGFFYMLIGVLSSLMSSIVIEIVSSKRNDRVMMTIISTKWEEINHYIIQDMERGSTLSTVHGGYQENEYRQIVTVVSNLEEQSLLSKISEIDETAFVTTIPVHAVNGEGFDKFPEKKKKFRVKIKK